MLTDLSASVNDIFTLSTLRVHYFNIDLSVELFLKTDTIAFRLVRPTLRRDLFFS